MPKWKNILQDRGAFVIPAATTLGATALTGGAALGPMALLAAGGAGARGFARNEEQERLRKMMRRQAEEDRQAQAMANLINALQPGSGARARPSEIAMPKRGLGETIAGGAAQGIQAYQLAQIAKDALEKRARDKITEEAKIEGLKASDEYARELHNVGGPPAGVGGLIEDPIVEALRKKQGGLSLKDRQRRADMGFATEVGKGSYVMPTMEVTTSRPSEEKPLGWLSGYQDASLAERQMRATETKRSDAIIKAYNTQLRATERASALTRAVIKQPRSLKQLEAKDRSEVIISLSKMVASGDPEESNRALGPWVYSIGRDLTAKEQGKLDSGRNVLKGLARIDELYKQVNKITFEEKNGQMVPKLGTTAVVPGGGGLGMVATRINIPGGPDAVAIREMGPLITTVTVSLRNAQETGVMTDKDLERWLPLLPDIYAGDQKTEYLNLMNLTSKMREKFGSFTRNLSSIGVRTGDFGAAAEGVGGAGWEDIIEQAERGVPEALEFLRYAELNNLW